MKNLELEFHKDMIRIYENVKRETKYDATRFKQLVGNHGGLIAAKKLIASDSISTGFEVLWEFGRLDLSMESLVVKPKYASLFTDEEIEICRGRLSIL